MKRLAICLFRNDLRLTDQPLLSTIGDYTLPIYCLDPRQVYLPSISRTRPLTFVGDVDKMGPFRKR